MTRDGRVKVLDFGLAQQDRAGSPRAATTASRPPLARRTEPGTVLGTVGYMSPEQVRGQPADARSDIFSLGAVLYEMLTGRRAFRRETAAETMTAILREDPPEPAASTGAAAALARIVEHCLEKRPDRASSRRATWPSRSRRLGRQPGPAGVAVAAPEKRPRWRPRLAAAALVALAARGAGGPAPGASGVRLPPAKATTPASFVQLTDQPGVENSPRSPPTGRAPRRRRRRPRGGSTSSSCGSAGAIPEPDRRLPGRRLPARLSLRTARRIAFRSERRGRGLRHGLDRRVGEAADRLRLQPGLVARRPRDRGGLGAGAIASRSGSGARSGRSTSRPARRAVTPPATTCSPRGRRTGGASPTGACAAGGSATCGRWPGRLGGGGRRGDERRRSRLEPGLGAGRPPSLLLEQPGRHHEPLAGRSTRRRAGARRARAPPVPSGWSGHPGLTRDGRPLVFASLDWRTTLMRAALDPVRARVSGGAGARAAEHPADPRPRSLARRPVDPSPPAARTSWWSGPTGARTPPHRRRLSRPWRHLAARRPPPRLLLRPRGRLRGLDGPPGRERVEASDRAPRWADVPQLVPRRRRDGVVRGTG